MNSGDVAWVLREMGLRKVKSTSDHKVVACCPFGFAHDSGKDENPSFCVLFGEGLPKYVCMGCRRKGRLLHLVWYFARTQSSSRWKTIFDSVVRTESGSVHSEPDDEVRERRPARTDSTAKIVGDWFRPEGYKPQEVSQGADEPWPVLPDLMESGGRDAILRMLARPLDERAVVYLTSTKRKLTGATIDAWELGWNPERERIAIPVRDHKGRLVGVSGRLREVWDADAQIWVSKGRGPKFLHSEGFKRDHVLFGEHMLEGRGSGYIVEGQFDAIKLWQSGYQAVALMGTYASRTQAEKIKHYFTDVVVVPDGDKAGREMGLRVAEQLAGIVPVRVVRLPDKVDPDELTDDLLRGLLGSPTHIRC